MTCLAPNVSPEEAICTSLLFTLFYVLSLYLPFNIGNRNQRPVILSRLTTLTLLALILEIYIRQRVPFLQHKKSAGTRIPALIVAALLTLLLYAGHLAVTPGRDLTSYPHLPLDVRYVLLRNYFAGPLLEEIVFRRQTLIIWSCQSTVSRLLFPAAMFSLAHIHHVRELGFVGLCFQMAYTFLFGVYAAALYINTMTFWAPFVAHVICNVLGLPDFVAIARHPHRRLLSLFYASAVLLFAISFEPLTTLVQPCDFATE